VRNEVSYLTWTGKKLLGLIGLADANEKMRDNAANWLELAEKVWDYRRDQLNATESAELLERTANVRQKLTERVPAEKLKLAVESLEEVLRRTGGAIYPKSALVENVEFFLVAAIVILGIRTYFVQPFKIPTNSMWPTYNGMTPEVFVKPADEPSAPSEALRAVAFGAWPHRLDAAGDGEILVPIGGSESRGIVHCRIVPGRSWLVFPTKLREYTLLVDNQPTRVRVPLDFDFDWVISEALFPSGESYSQRRLITEIERRLKAGEFEVRIVDGERMRCIRTGRRVRSGERILSFDELTGDQLFVDRFSYHFMKPAVGSGFVFRTGNIAPLVQDYGDQYFVKRLVGVPGDTLEVQGTGVIRNHAPITGATAFDANARRLGKYPGYVAMGLLAPGQSLRVPSRNFFAMGDNSPNSQDGRYWGFVPAKDVVGRPLFVYFPFTQHWGLAR
jgi:signal peptidase I